MSGEIVRMNELGKRYGGPTDGPWAVRDVTLSVFAGEVTLLMGPSGSGKTTLLTMIGGLVEPTEGFLRVCDTTLTGSAEPERQRFRRDHVGFVFQSSNLLRGLTAAENVGVGLALRGADPAGAEALLRQVGLAARSGALPDELSGGQRQRVAVARALAGDPELLLADEPTAALDAEQGRGVMGLLRLRARERGTGVLVVTHDPRMRDYADRVIEMEDGGVVRTLRRGRRPARIPDEEVHHALA